MATLTIRQLDDMTKLKLRVRAAHHGRSMEEEAREILRASLDTPMQQPMGLARAIRQRFAPFRGVELQLPKRTPMRQPPGFSA
ncbi:MAG: FitA-like ribbon-helix-helix domain-containing protein [Acidobacteriaceae bacterium]